MQEAYGQREYRPMWSGQAGPLPRAGELVGALCRADQEGLRRSRVDLEGLRRAVEQAYGAGTPDSQAWADLDLRLTAAFLDYATALQSGELDLAAIDSGRYVRSRVAQRDSALRTALRAEQFGEMIRQLRPTNEGFRGLVGALASYRAAAAGSGWPRVPALELKRGSRGPAVAALQARLAATGDLAVAKPVNARYDEEVARAVANFQERHGLSVDSMVGNSTLGALNVPVETRIRQIELNLDRHRWLPPDFGQRYILVNIPEFMLYAYEDGAQARAMRIIVGREYEGATPVLSDSISHLVFQPSWNVPIQLAREELVPKVRRDASYLAEHRFEVVRNATGDVVANPASIDWSHPDQALGRFGLRQEPGGDNPMGEVKFAFPNQFNVYLHDTPDRELFRRRQRALSHGCIRVEEPARLAEYTLRETTGWDVERIRAAMKSDGRDAQDRGVKLARKVPIYILYLTAFWRNGKVHFRDDVYGLDGQQQLAGSPVDEGAAGQVCDQITSVLGGQL